MKVASPFEFALPSKRYFGRSCRWHEENRGGFNGAGIGPTWSPDDWRYFIFRRAWNYWLRPFIAMGRQTSDPVCGASLKDKFVHQINSDIGAKIREIAMEAM